MTLAKQIAIASVPRKRQLRHSVIEIQDGSLLDVTPRETGQSEDIRDFRRWSGSEEAFWAEPDQGWFEPIGGFKLPVIHKRRRPVL